MNGDRVLRIVATLTLWLAPLPAAFFVGRSVYWHLIHNWHLDLGVLGIVAAVLAGGMVELVGILSAHVALATWRWNQKGIVKREVGGWESAPFTLALACFIAYAIAAILLAVVLEAVPAFAVWAPALFTLMAGAAYVSVGVYEQHRDRLAYYGLGWNWKRTAQKDATEARTDETETQTDATEVQTDTADAPPMFATAKERVRWLRQQHPELERWQLAAAAGCSLSTVSRALTGNERKETES